jgi:unsaturated rhamnogalacturonyl hydrolase
MVTVRNLLILIMIVAAFHSCGSSRDQISEIPSASSLADNFMRLFPDTIAYKSESKSYKWNYEQGLMYEALYQVWKHTGDKKYFDYMKKNIDYYIEPNGTIKTYKLSDFNIDNIAPGRTLLRLYSETRSLKYKKSADTLREQLRLHPRTTEGGFWHKKIYPYQMWLDGLYMGEPFYAMYSQMFDGSISFEDIADQFIFIRNHLRDDITGLFYHGWDESKQQKWADSVTGRSPNYWGRAIGWYMMALVDVLEIFPAKHPKYNELLGIFVNLAENLKKYRDLKTKLWYQVLDKGNLGGNYLEASGSLMFIYSFAKGSNNKYLEHEYLNTAKESFRTVIQYLVATDSQGLLYLNNICAGAGLGGNPYRDGSFDYYVNEARRVNDFKGYGPFILAAIEIEKGDQR